MKRNLKDSCVQVDSAAREWTVDECYSTLKSSCLVRQENLKAAGPASLLGSTKATFALKMPEEW